MLELVGQAIGRVSEAWNRRAIASARRGSAGVLLLVWGRIVVKVALVVDSTCCLLSTPYLLLPRRIWKWLWEGGGSGREGTTVLTRIVGTVVEAEVELQAGGVAAVDALLLLLEVLLLLVLLLLALLLLALLLLTLLLLALLLLALLLRRLILLVGHGGR